MGSVTDSVGRTFDFDKIRVQMDETLLQLAALEVRDQSKERGQLVFDRYCRLHQQKYRCNYEPGHFANGQLVPRFAALYANPAPVISFMVTVTAGLLFEQYIGIPVEEIEAAIRRDPRAWVAAGHLVAAET